MGGLPGGRGGILRRGSSSACNSERGLFSFIAFGDLSFKLLVEITEEFFTDVFVETFVSILFNRSGAFTGFFGGGGGGIFSLEAFLFVLILYFLILPKDL